MECKRVPHAVGKNRSSMNSPAERPALAAFVGAAAAAFVTLPALGAGTLWDNSETAYGEVAREILLTHDWVVMHFNGAPYFVQPPLFFWLGAIFSLVWGAGTLALRLPSALATIALAAAVGQAGAKAAGTRLGIYAGVISSSCLMQAVIGRLAIMDALLDLAVALTVLWWFRALTTGQGRYAIYGWVAAGFGVLAKGPVAPVVAIMVIVPFALWEARRGSLRLPALRAWVWGALACAAITLPWPLAVVARDHLAPLRELIGVYTVGRYTGVIENQSGPIWYYLPVIVLGFFPWTAFLPMAIADGVRRLRCQDEARGPLLRLALVWSVVPLVFFSFAGTKLPNYVALEFPGLALLTACYFDAVAERGGALGATLSASLIPVTIGMVAIAIGLFVHDNRLGVALGDLAPGLIGLGAAVFAGSALTAVLLARRKTASAAPYALALAIAVGIDVLAIVVLPRAEIFKPVPRLAAVIDRDRKPHDAVAIQNLPGGNALLFYTRPPVEVLAAPADGAAQAGAIDPRRAICHARRIWVIAPRKSLAKDPTYGRRRRVVAADGTAALLLYEGPPCRENG
jgi:4-amino-4-deoxy-L-arabinose transferase-like glycosyltransferase